MKRDFMKKLMLISLFFMPYCKAAAYQPYVDPSKGKGKLIEDKEDTESWDRAVMEFQPIEQKETLDLSNKEITSIPAGLNLSELMVLRLKNNQIAVIPDDLILPQLIILRLENNQIAAIPDDFNLPRLQHLHLENNQIAAIPVGLDLLQLRGLHLKNNQIKEIDAQGFRQILQGLPNLRKLDLSGNAISQKNVDDLRQVAAATHPNLEIIAEDIGGVVLKPAKVKK